MERHWEVPTKISRAVRWAAQFDFARSGWGSLDDPDARRLEWARADALYALRAIENPAERIRLLRRAVAEFPPQDGSSRIAALLPREQRGIKLLLDVYGKGI